MPKTRLTTRDREIICAAIIDHKFTPIEAALKAEENALAIQIRAKAHGKHLALVDAAPDGAFPVDSDVTVNVNGRRLRFCFGPDYKTTARLFYQFTRDVALSLSDGDEFGAKLLDHATRAETARAYRKSLRQEVGATVFSFRSFEDLQAGWPEADRFITERWRARGDYVSNVPAGQISALTAALDLPPEIAEAA